MTTFLVEARLAWSCTTLSLLRIREVAFDPPARLDADTLATIAEAGESVEKEKWLTGFRDTVRADAPREGGLAAYAPVKIYGGRREESSRPSGWVVIVPAPARRPLLFTAKEKE